MPNCQNASFVLLAIWQFGPNDTADVDLPARDDKPSALLNCVSAIRLNW